MTTQKDNTTAGTAAKKPGNAPKKGSGTGPKKATGTTAKTASKSLTPKQAVTKTTSLVRGIDNAAIAIKKQQAIIEQNVEQVKQIVAGIGNAPVQKPAAAAPKQQQKPTQAKKPAAKPAKPAKPAAKPAKTAAKRAAPPKAKPAKPAKPAKAPSSQAQQGPTIKEAAIAVLKENGGTMKAAEIWHRAQEKYGRTWSRQVLYNALNKNPDVFVPTGEGADRSFKFGGGSTKQQANGKKEDKDVDNFVDRASKNEAVSNVL